jgi:hypothetical protein
VAIGEPSRALHLHPVLAGQSGEEAPGRIDNLQAPGVKFERAAGNLNCRSRCEMAADHQLARICARRNACDPNAACLICEAPAGHGNSAGNYRMRTFRAFPPHREAVVSSIIRRELERRVQPVDAVGNAHGDVMISIIGAYGQLGARKRTEWMFG